jgi:hypothetical protein
MEPWTSQDRWDQGKSEGFPRRESIHIQVIWIQSFPHRFGADEQLQPPLFAFVSRPIIHSVSAESLKWPERGGCLVGWCGWPGRGSWSLEPGARWNCEIELPRSRRQLLEDHGEWDNTSSFH